MIVKAVFLAVFLFFSLNAKGVPLGEDIVMDPDGLITKITINFNPASPPVVDIDSHPQPLPAYNYDNPVQIPEPHILALFFMTGMVFCLMYLLKLRKV